jgi:hypothetical protein
MEDNSKTKLSHDATATTRGTLYQLWVAVQKCYEMFQLDQMVLIETQGDVTKNKEEQTEVKHYSDPLTDNHICFWKTLNNWMQEAFDPTSYSTLILLTTQEFGQNSTISEWNDKSPNERLAIIEKIVEQAEDKYTERVKNTEKGKSKPEPSEVLKYQRNTLAKEHREKLKEILNRFYIEAASPRLPDLYNKIKGLYLKGILEGKQDNFLNSLFGFITKPGLEREQHWEISYSDFCAKVAELTEQYRKGTRTFPRVNIHNEDVQNIKSSERLFVQKIHDIEYSEVILDAIKDYLEAIKTIQEEFRTYSVPLTRTVDYTNDVIRIFTQNHRCHSRNCSNVVKDSKNFYDKITTAIPLHFGDFEATPLWFRNGLLHTVLDDESKNLKWRLEPNE